MTRWQEEALIARIREIRARMSGPHADPIAMQTARRSSVARTDILSPEASPSDRSRAAGEEGEGTGSP